MYLTRSSTQGSDYTRKNIFHTFSQVLHTLVVFSIHSIKMAKTYFSDLGNKTLATLNKEALNQSVKNMYTLQSYIHISETWLKKMSYRTG